MALTRDFLKGLNLEESVIDKIIDAHKSTATALSEANTRLEALKTEVAELKPAAEAAKTEKARADRLDSEFTAYKATVAANEQKAKVDSAYRALAKAANVDDKRLDTVVKWARAEGILTDAKLKADGTLEGADKLTEAIKTEWADFINSENLGGTNPATPPNGNVKDETNLAAVAAAMGLPPATK